MYNLRMYTGHMKTEDSRATLSGKAGNAITWYFKEVLTFEIDARYIGQPIHNMHVIQ